MATSQQIAACNLYANLMDEIRVRLAAIDHGTLGKLGLSPPFVREFCFLQLRMICELISLGCLTAHGEIVKSKKLRKEWDAGRIMHELERLHPNFYPKPYKIRVGSPGNFITEAKPTFSKQELLKLYGECGDFLHRGSAKQLLQDNASKNISYPEITERAQKLNDLLTEHVVMMLGDQTIFVCILRSRPLGKPHVSIAEAN